MYVTFQESGYLCVSQYLPICCNPGWLSVIQPICTSGSLETCPLHLVCHITILHVALCTLYVVRPFTCLLQCFYNDLVRSMFSSHLVILLCEDDFWLSQTSSFYAVSSTGSVQLLNIWMRIVFVFFSWFWNNQLLGF